MDFEEYNLGSFYHPQEKKVKGWVVLNMNDDFHYCNLVLNLSWCSNQLDSLKEITPSWQLILF
jgi:hypothetical protein